MRTWHCFSSSRFESTGSKAKNAEPWTSIFSELTSTTGARIFFLYSLLCIDAVVYTPSIPLSPAYHASEEEEKEKRKDACQEWMNKWSRRKQMTDFLSCAWHVRYLVTVGYICRLTDRSFSPLFFLSSMQWWERLVRIIFSFQRRPWTLQRRKLIEKTSTMCPIRVWISKIMPVCII